MTSRLNWLRNALFVDEPISATETRLLLRPYLLAVGFAVALFGDLVIYLISVWNVELSPGLSRWLDMLVLRLYRVGGGLCMIVLVDHFFFWMQGPRFLRIFVVGFFFLSVMLELALAVYTLSVL